MSEFFEDYIAENLSVYEYLKRNSSFFGKKTAISFYGKKYSFQELFEQIDNIADALTAYGIKKNDVVCSSLPGCPEGVFLIYAINKIGAIYCAFDCRSKKDDIEQTFQTFAPKLCFIPDFQLKEFKDIYNFPTVHISVINSLGMPTVKFFELANLIKGRTTICKKHKNIFSYKEFIKKASEGISETVEKSVNNIFGYFYTSGTTYGRKSVILTNENVNAAAYQQKCENSSIKSGDSILNIMPLFTCYSVSLAVHLPLSSGVEVKLVPLIKTQKLKKLLLKEKPNFIITVPAHWEHFIRQNHNQCDYSFIKNIIIGGDVLATHTHNRLNEIFGRCGINAPVIKGYGLSETTSTATTTIRSISQQSVGLPLKNTLIAIFSENLIPLSPYQKGEICISGPTVFSGYYADAKMTTSSLVKHSDGRVWLHTGDIGYLDENGELFFCERKKRMYVRFDGSKISPFSIEQTILKCAEVENCMVIAIKDTEHTHGMCAKAIIVLKNKKRCTKRNVVRFINKHLNEHTIPKQIVFADKLPYTKNGKLNYFYDLQ